MTEAPVRRTQKDRRERSRNALLEAAARGFSRHGYAGLTLERVAAEAGYTRGALYHQFAGKQELALAVVEWVGTTWEEEVRAVAAAAGDPVEELVALARAHAVYCRRDVARVMLVLRVELAAQDHPVGRVVGEALVRLQDDCAALVEAGRRAGTIPEGAPADVLAGAYLAVVESVGIELAGREPHDTDLAERAVRGVLGLTTTPEEGRR